jgi:hypothetical protein
MSITFGQFIELVEGKKKKEIKRLKSAYLAGQEQAPRQIVNYGDSAPNSPERQRQISAMMGDSGGGAVRKAKEKREKEAEKAAKNILNREGFSYGSKSYQQELEKKKNEAQNQKNQERQQSSSDLYNERTRGRGIRSRSKGRDGWIKNGVFTPDEDD